MESGLLQMDGSSSGVSGPGVLMLGSIIFIAILIAILIFVKRRSTKYMLTGSLLIIYGTIFSIMAIMATTDEEVGWSIFLYWLRNFLVGFGVLLILIGIIIKLTKESDAPVGQVRGHSERFCPQCGRVIPFDAYLCPYCGNSFPLQSQTTRPLTQTGTRVCPICGKQLNYIEQYKQWYCYSCQEYQQPQKPLPPPPPDY